MASERLTLEAANEAAGMRIDKWLAMQLPELSRSRIEALISGGGVVVNGKNPSKSLKLKGGEQIELEIPEPQ